MAKQAASQSITVPASTSDAPIIGLEHFAEPSTRTIVYPVPNDAWAPVFKCGEFAVVDLNNRDLEEDCFILWRSSSMGDMKIVRLRVWDNERDGRIVGVRKPDFIINNRTGEKYWKHIHWHMLFGQSRMYFVDGRPSETYMSADGPITDRYMRQQCVGRLIGIMGGSGRSLSWKGART